MRCAALAARVRQPPDEARVTFLLGLVKYHLGELEEAERLGLQALEWLERTGDSYFQLQNLRTLALCARRPRRTCSSPRSGCERRCPLALEIGGWLVVEIYRCLVDVLIRQDRSERSARARRTRARRTCRRRTRYARAAGLADRGEPRDRRGPARGRGRGLRRGASPARGAAAAARSRRGAGRVRPGAPAARGRRSEPRRSSGAPARSSRGWEARGLVEEIDRELAELTEGAGLAGPLTSP